MKEQVYNVIRVDDVKISNRYRQDLGDVASLAKSIEEIGLLNPITVTYDNELIAGQRRLEAFKLLGRVEIPSLAVKDLSTAVMHLTAERDENEERKEMTVSEKVALAQALEEMERAEAEQRTHEARVRAGKIRQGVYKPDDSPNSSGELFAGQVRDIAGRAVGFSPTSYQRAKAVVVAANDPDAPPEQRQVAVEALAEMDQTGKVVPAYEKVRAARHEFKTRPPTPPPASSPKQSPPPASSPAKQRKSLTNADHTLSGIAMGLDQIADSGLSEEITSDEAAHWVDGLVKSRRSIERVINLLRERSNA